MDRIYKEDPGKWPHGLQMSGFDGGVYMIREASTGSPVGFTGWQEKRGSYGERVGYYSIGILPDYRRNGYAKAAVNQLLHDKSANVDRVEAFIAKGNKPSIALADALGVDVVTEPHTKRASRAGSIAQLLGMGGANAVLWDPEVEKHGLKGLGENWDMERIRRAILNAGIGAIGGHNLMRGTQKLAPANPKNFGMGVKQTTLGLTTLLSSLLLNKDSGDAPAAVIQKAGSVKEAGGKAEFAKMLGYGSANAAFWDPALEEHGFAGLKGEHWDANRVKQTLLNMGVGMIGGPMAVRGGKRLFTPGATRKDIASGTKLMSGGLGVLMMTPLKDILMNSIDSSKKLPKALDKYTNQGILSPEGMSDKARIALALLGAGGLAGAGILAHKRNKATEELAEATRESANPGGRVRLSLPTKDPNDIETNIDLPIEEIMLPQYIKQELSRDTRSRLRQEGKERKRKRQGRPKA